MKNEAFGLIIYMVFTFIYGYGQRGAYQMPYIRYEAEEARLGGDAIIYEALEFRQNKTASEASNQKYVSLPSLGAYVEWIVNEESDGATLRFTMPDSPDGTGQEGTLAVFVNDTYVKTIDLTSYWAYQYFPDSDPTNTPFTNPRMRFDETHFRLDTLLNNGDLLRIEKTTEGGPIAGIDFIELEKIPPRIEKPANAYSVTDYGAIPNDEINDLDAFQQCLEEADDYGADVYIPEGKFILDDQLIIDISDMQILGAGMWYTEIYFTTNAIRGGGIIGGDSASNLEISNFYLHTALNSRLIDGNYAEYSGFSNAYGVNSRIHHIWLEHFEAGFWIGDYVPFIAQTINLVISHCRIRNNYADGVNFTQGTSYSIVEHCNVRNNGDDALACWPNDYQNAKEPKNNFFRYNTVEHTWRAAGIAIFGGDGHQVHHNIIKDGFAGSGIRLTTDFPGYHFQNTTEIKLYENRIINCGTSDDLWGGERGAIELAASNDPINHITFQDIDILNSQRNAIQMGQNAGFSNINFSDINIDGTGLDPYIDSKFIQNHDGKAIMIYTSNGEASFHNIAMTNIEAVDPILIQAGFNYEISEVDEEYLNPKHFFLGNNYPNPFNSATRIDYALPQKTKVKLTVYDLSGRIINTLISMTQEQGNYSIIFNAKHLSSGNYFYRLQAGSYDNVKPMLYIK